MWTVGMLSWLLWAAEPIPDAEAVGKAEAMLEEVYGQELRAAKTAAEKAKLAQEFLRVAQEDKDSANRYVLAQRAKQLAIQALDSRLAVQAAEILAGFESPEGPLPPKEAASRAHALWTKSEVLKGQERLSKQIEAAELYLRVLDQLEGLEKTVAQRRLKDLGWGRYVFAFEFEKDTEGWTGQPTADVNKGNHVVGLHVEKGCLVGKIIGGDPYLVRLHVRYNGDEVRTIEIRMAVTNAVEAQFFWITQESPGWHPDKSVTFAITGDGTLRTYRIDMTRHPNWRGKTIIGIRVDPGEWDHRLPRSEWFKIDYIRGLP
ncbi:MAG: hypothetical protein NZ602_13495 [Thermoguttaceae bacterium]|nr:hypothetical protein [Thermoguttaceae bacterium]MDW8038181.1 hypothetical protein [Thermoguttaceae bacterium]